MTTIADAVAELKAAITSVDGLRVGVATLSDLDPPCAVILPPRLEFTGMGRGPRNGRFLVAVVVPADDQALDRLWDLVPRVSDAIDRQSDGAVIDAVPTAVQSGGASLPSYEITVEVPL